MRFIRNLFIVLFSIVVVGLVRRPFDNRFVDSMQERNLLPPPISLDTREELGQTSLAIALGGLRPLVAAMLNIKAHTYWEQQDWYELEQGYKTIVALQPRVRYYWEIGSWHLYSNAYADYADKPGLSDGRRKLRQKEFFEKGTSFLQRGIDQNPQDWRLYYLLGSALSSNHRPQDLERAQECFAGGYARSGVPRLQRFSAYCLSRIPARKAEAWEAVRGIWTAGEHHRKPTTQTVFFALQSWAGKDDYSLEDIFGSSRKAAAQLPDYWFRQVEGFPMDGVAETLRVLCREFEVPRHLNPLLHPPEQVFEMNPLTGQAFGTHPMTGEPRTRTWRNIWMNRPRDDYLLHLRKKALVLNNP
ncbi:MAG: hypothetical protein CMO40_07465 [Verrucomicrobiaceae bacterium]|nr:hypothetical protein [Verrucomicrobiaceae bacterium]